MKDIFVIILLTVQASTTWPVFESNDEIYTPVSDTINNLLNDEIDDIRKTVDCTIFAVELLLAKDILEYQQRCGDGSGNVIDDFTYSEIMEDMPSQYEAMAVNINDELVQSNNSSINDEVLADKFDKTLTELNNTYRNIIHNENIDTKLEYVRNTLKKESSRLVKVNNYLNSKIQNISLDLKEKQDDFTEKSSKFEDVWEKIKSLCKNQENSNDRKITEIETIMNEILTILQANEADNTSSTVQEKITTRIHNLADDINKTILEHVTEIPIMDKNMDSIFETIKHSTILDMQNEDQLSTESPTMQITNDTSELKVTENYSLITPDTIEDLIEQDSVQSSEPEVVPDYMDFFMKDTTDVESIPVVRKEEVKKIIDEHKNSQAMIDKYFNNPKYVVDDIFAFTEDGFVLNNKDLSFDDYYNKEQNHENDNAGSDFYGG